MKYDWEKIFHPHQMTSEEVVAWRWAVEESVEMRGRVATDANLAEAKALYAKRREGKS